MDDPGPDLQALTRTAPGTSGWFAYDDRLYAALGRVAAESALLDEFLWELLDELVGDLTSRLFSGQSTDWLLKAVKLMLGEIDPFKTKYSAAHHAAMSELLNRADSLRNHRHQVLHGVWTVDAHFDENTRPRPFGDDEETPVLACTRGRPRRGYQEQLWSVGDVSRVAQEFADVRRALAALMREMEPDAHPLLPRW